MDTLWGDLREYYDGVLKKNHLRELLKDEKRNKDFTCQFEDIVLDYTHEKID